MAYYHCDIEELANTERPFLRIAKYDDDDSLAMAYVHLFDNTPEELQEACRTAVDVALHGDLACIPTKYANELGMYPDEEDEIPDDALLLTGNIYDLSIDESGCIDMDEADIDQPGMFWGYKDPSEYMEENYGIKSTYAVSETIGNNLWVSVSNGFAEDLRNGEVTLGRLNNIIEKASLIAEDSPHQTQDIDFYKEVSNARRL